MFEELEIVELAQDIKEHNLKEGERGTIVEIYKDGNLIDVSSPNPDKEQTRIRLFLWSRSENLFSKQKDSIGIKKIRESISKI